tara:strand:- start:320 stop:598 length:279 start_codon:yes stop_codon:yes gene_type:complete
MEINLNEVKEVLRSREDKCNKLASKLDKMNDLTRNLLSALSSSIGREDTIGYKEKQVIKEETKSLHNYLDTLENIELGLATGGVKVEGKIDY